MQHYPQYSFCYVCFQFKKFPLYFFYFINHSNRKFILLLQTRKQMAAEYLNFIKYTQRLQFIKSHRITRTTTARLLCCWAWTFEANCNLHTRHAILPHSFHFPPPPWTCNVRHKSKSTHSAKVSKLLQNKQSNKQQQQQQQQQMKQRNSYNYLCQEPRLVASSLGALRRFVLNIETGDDYN